ncbi:MULTISPECIES: hypothetical protein [unclassified Streptomyces]|nr:MULTISPECIES: hypothetical protein [unclassified Streptomyces]
MGWRVEWWVGLVWVVPEEPMREQGPMREQEQEQAPAPAPAPVCT